MELDPNDPVLTSQAGPHEARAVMRMHRAGWPGPIIAKTFGLKATQLVQGFSLAMDEESRAHAQGRAIHDPVVRKK